jgi:hypothetical protein
MRGFGELKESSYMLFILWVAELHLSLMIHISVGSPSKKGSVKN